MKVCLYFELYSITFPIIFKLQMQIFFASLKNETIYLIEMKHFYKNFNVELFYLFSGLNVHIYLIIFSLDCALSSICNNETQCEI